MALRNQPYLPLYIQDYLTDEKLNNCSWETQGIYIKILCILHKMNPYGAILFKQTVKQTDKQNSEICLTVCLSFVYDFASILLKHIPCEREIMEKSINELLVNKVLLYDGEKLYQKRMLKDGMVSEKRSAAGKNGGGNPVLFKQKVKQEDKQKDKQTLNMNMNIISSLPEEENKGGVGENFITPYLTKRIAEIFYKFNPNDMPDDSEDLRSCLTISRKIEMAKHWGSGSSLNGKMEETIAEWEKILDHIQTKEFFKRFSLKNISNQFQSVWKSYISENQTKESFKTIDLKVDKSIRGVSISEDLKFVILSDGSKVEAVGEEKEGLKMGFMKPDDFFKGMHEWE